MFNINKAKKTLFEYLSNEEFSLKERNQKVFLLLQDCLSKKYFTILRVILEDSRIEKLHPSILMSVLIMIDHIEKLEKYKNNLTTLLNKKIP